jgi:hypothetical protein
MRLPFPEASQISPAYSISRSKPSASDRKMLCHPTLKRSTQQNPIFRRRDRQLKTF